MVDARFDRMLSWTWFVVVAGVAAAVVMGCDQRGMDGPGDGPGLGVDGSRSDAGVDAPVDGPPRSDGPAASDQKPADALVVPGTWITAPKGTFTMGTQAGEFCTGPHEDQHQVTLTRDFEIQSTEVTQEQFHQLMGYNPSHYGPSGKGPACGKDCPVENVSWHESAAYCNVLSTLAGKPPCYTCSGSGVTVACEEQATHLGQKIYLSAHHELEHVHPAIEHVEDPLLRRVGAGQVDHLDGLGLANPAGDATCLISSG